MDDLIVIFFNLLMDVDFFFWNFGDGEISIVEDLVYIFFGFGIYDVIFNVFNFNCFCVVMEMIFL